MAGARIEYAREPEGVEVREVRQGGYGITRDGQLWRYPRRKKKKPGWIFGTGYPLRFALDGRKAMVLASRLVAEAWLPNPEDLRFVRFKDGNPNNICVENLYWSRTTGGGRPRRSVVCEQTGQVFDSIKDAGQKLGIAPSQISAQLAKRLPHAKKLTFKYSDATWQPKWQRELANRQTPPGLRET